MERSGSYVDIAVSYHDISRAGDNAWFGYSDKTWVVMTSSDALRYYHNNIATILSGPMSSRIGVYLDRSAGTLSFYSVTDPLTKMKKMTLLHKVETKFGQPLYPGFKVGFPGDTAEIVKLW